MAVAMDNPKDPQWMADRADSDSLKWNRYKGTDILPMWVADMDVRCAEPILQALCRRVEHGIFGYGVPGPETTDAVIQWLKRRHHWSIQPEWLVWTPGLVSALNVVCRAFAGPNDEILTFTPIYPPFLAAPDLSGRKRLTCPLANINGRYTIDMDALRSVVTPQTRVLLFCNPHNPVGRVWEKESIRQVADFCLERGILFCSDEIHCDLILDRSLRHTPTAVLSPAIAANTVTLMSPAKTFNLPGLNCGFVIIPDPRLRKLYKQTARDIVPHVNVLGYAACRAAFTQADDWLAVVLDDLRENHRILYDGINDISGLSMALVEATYLAWIDIQRLELDKPAAFFRKAGIGIIDGTEFGQPGFIRLNFACCRDNLLAAMERIRRAVRQI